MGTEIKPIIKKINDNAQSLKSFQETLIHDASAKERDILLEFPTVYIHNWKDPVEKARDSAKKYDEL